MASVRKAVYRHLEPAAWPKDGLSPINVFLVEYVARVWVAVENPLFKTKRFPRLRYMVTPIAIIDLLAVLPSLFAFGGAPSLLLRFFRVLRIVRLAKLGRTSKALQYIRDAIVDKRYEFGLVLGLLAITVLVSSSLLYLAEAEAQPDKFGSIPRALWWAVVTLTTVGYGDVYPETMWGRVAAGLVALAGVGIVALPTGILASSFAEEFRERHEREQAAKKARETARAGDQS